LNSKLLALSRRLCEIDAECELNRGFNPWRVRGRGVRKEGGRDEGFERNGEVGGLWEGVDQEKAKKMGYTK
jgi:hypothetical protein